MKFKISEVKTAKGAKRQELRVWDFGPERLKKTLRFSTSKELFLELDGLRLLEDRLSKGDAMDVKVQTLEALVDDYMKRQSSTYSAGWQMNQRAHWEQLKKITISGKQPLGEITADQLRADTLKSVEKHLLATGNKQRTVNIKLQFVRSVTSFALAMGKIEKNYLSDFKFTKPVKTDIDFWELEDAQDFLAAMKAKYAAKVDSEWIYVVYLTMINTGLRAGELWALKPRCLRFERGLMRIDEQHDRVSKTFTPPKGKGPRNVPMNDQVAEALSALILKKRIGRNELIFPNQEGRPIDHDNFYNRVFKKEFGDVDGRWAGPEITFHGLRHTAATLMLNANIDVKTVQEILGHADISTTMRYVHALSSNVERASRLFSVVPSAERRLKLINNFG